MLVAAAILLGLGGAAVVSGTALPLAVAATPLTIFAPFAAIAGPATAVISAPAALPKPDYPSFVMPESSDMYKGA